MGLGTLAFSSTAASAQSAEETVNVGLAVQIDSQGAAISGLEDIALTVTSLDFGSLSHKQMLCFYSPTRFFSMTVTGDIPSGHGEFILRDHSQTDPNLDTFNYTVAMRHFSNGNPYIIAGFANGFAETGIDGEHFIADRNCTAGENLQLLVSFSDPNLEELLPQLADGQQHLYTSVLILLIEPEI